VAIFSPSVRSALRFALPLLAVLGLLAWGATLVVDATARAWFERDVSLRARLAVSGAREGLAAHVRSGDRRRLAALLEDIARDDRILAVEVCSAGLAPLAATTGFPEEFGCSRVGPQARSPSGPGGFTWSPVERTAHLRGGRTQVSAVPLEDRGETLGLVVLVQDLSWADRRQGSTRQFTLLAFALVAAAGSVATFLVARFSWRRWTAEMRKFLRLSRSAPGDVRDGARRKEFQPLLADVRDLVASLAQERDALEGGPWSPERLRQTLTRHLHGEGVIVVANREPYIHEYAPDGRIRVAYPASGLVSALEPVMRACSGTWVAHGSGSADRQTVDRHDRIRVPPGEESYALHRVWLSPEEEQGYYYGFANEGLWPLCHVVHARPTFRIGDWEHYQRVNQRFAEVAQAEAPGTDPIVLVQDYHFALLPRMLRERIPRATIIAFWHIPWPNAESFGICPWHRELLRGLLGGSVIGFHTQAHCNNFLEAVDRYLEARIDRERQSVILEGRETLVRPYPISVEWPSHWLASLPPVAECRRQVLEAHGLPPQALLGVGVDRLDYTKGIEERLLAVERLLERFPEHRGRFTFIQLAAPSRTAIPRYRALNDAVEAMAARINEQYGSGSYRPVVLHREHHAPDTVFRYYRAADLCYVSSLHDGMNLVAKEFVSARDDEQGVLLLSRFTGAARELAEALLVNPYDLEEASSALAAALAMSKEEQAERMRALRAYVAEFNVYRWAGRMLVDAARLRQRERLTDRLAIGQGALVEPRGP
jgi:trehalose 6-phosphate synthase